MKFKYLETSLSIINLDTGKIFAQATVSKKYVWTVHIESFTNSTWKFNAEQGAVDFLKKLAGELN